MTAGVRCDAPDCGQFWEASRTGRPFATFRTSSGDEYHFCDEDCLGAWAASLKDRSSLAIDAALKLARGRERPFSVLDDALAEVDARAAASEPVAEPAADS